MKHWVSAGTKKRIAIATTVALLILVGMSALFGAFGYSSVCRRCGLERRGTDWQIPLTSISVCKSSSEKPTPVSVTLERNGTVGRHEHDWLFIHGAGNGITCALGSGDYISPTVRSD